MGYCATGKGYMVFKPMTKEEEQAFNNMVYKRFALTTCPQAIETSVRVVDVYMANIYYDCDRSEIDNASVVTVELQYHENYHEDEILAELNFFAPYLSSGNFEFCGEDNARWRFNFRNGEWYEDSGSIVYETDAPMEVRAKTEGKTITITISKGGYEIRLTADEFQHMVDEVNREVFYWQDVLNYLETLVESSELDEKALDDETAIRELVNLYADNRSEHDPGKGNFVWSHSESLEDAYNRCESINKYKKEN